LPMKMAGNQNLGSQAKGSTVKIKPSFISCELEIESECDEKE